MNECLFIACVELKKNSLISHTKGSRFFDRNRYSKIEKGIKISGRIMSEEAALENFLDASWCEICQYNYKFVFLPMLDQGTDPLTGRNCNISIQSEEPFFESTSDESQCGHSMSSCSGDEYTETISLAYFQENSVQCKDVEITKLKEIEYYVNENVREFSGLNESQSKSVKTFEITRNRNLFRSTICKKEISEWDSEEYANSHTGVKCECIECEGRFPRIFSLKVHKSSDTEEIPHGIYEKILLQRKAMWQMHMLSHVGEKLYKCDTCEKAFAKQQHLKQHTSVHAKIKPYGCNICEKTVSSKAALKRHELTHMTEKAHKCDICDKRFRRKENLKTHRLSHSREKPYKCYLCHERFRFNRTLKNHMGIHTRELLYENAI